MDRFVRVAYKEGNAGPTSPPVQDDGAMVMKRLLAVVAVLAAGWVLMPLFGMYRDEPDGDAAGVASNGALEPSDEPAGDRKGPRVQFAQDREPAAGEAQGVAIDGARALEYLKAVCALGPRMSGSPAMKRQQELIRKHFEELGAKVRTQPFTARQASQKGTVPMANLIVSFWPERTRRVILSSHYDTRPIADQEPDPRKWREPFVSANDGGSGVALLMELGHHMKGLTTKVGVDFVFFDGEEYVFERDRDRYFFGSQHFAQAWRRDKDRPDYAAALLFDMIAGKTAKFPLEGYSWNREPGLCRDVWGTAGELRCGRFLREVGDHVQDDHLALQQVGIPAIDIIDFNYPHWHRLTDVPENCAAEPLEQVGRVVTAWLQRVK